MSVCFFYDLLLIEQTSMPRGVFRGMNGAMSPPPLGRQDSIISIEWFAYHSILHTIATFGPKSGLNLSEELFFFAVFT